MVICDKCKTEHVFKRVIGLGMVDRLKRQYQTEYWPDLCDSCYQELTDLIRTYATGEPQEPSVGSF